MAPDMDPLVAVGGIVVFVGVMYLKHRSRRALRPDGWHLPFPVYLALAVVGAGVLFYVRSTS